MRKGWFEDLMLSMAFAVIFWGVIWVVCLSKDMFPNIKRNIGQGIEVMEDMQVEQARDIEVLRQVEREMADAEYDPSPK